MSTDAGIIDASETIANAISSLNDTITSASACASDSYDLVQVLSRIADSLERLADDSDDRRRKRTCVDR